MSFSSDVKKELCHTLPGRKCCAQAECYGILLYANRFDEKEARIVTESEDFAARLPLLFKKAFSISFDSVTSLAAKSSAYLKKAAVESKSRDVCSASSI